jgi:hypothetical protein
MGAPCTTRQAVVLPFPLDRVRPPRPSRTAAEPAGLAKVIPLPVRAAVLPLVVPTLPPAA